MTKPQPTSAERPPLRAVPAADGWDAEPAPLSARRLLPPFPGDTLPGWLGDQVAAVAEFTQTPADLAGCIGIAALSVAAGGRAVVEVRTGWREPVNLFTAVAMPPGSRKSAVFAAMTSPLLAAETALVELARPIVVEAELAARVARARAERTAKAAEAATTAEARMTAFADASSAALAAEEITVPGLPRLVADDVTPEAAASLLAEQSGRLAVLSAEAGIFATLAGRYSGAPNLEVFLKGHAGDMLRVDRKGRPAEHVERPALTLGLAIQPEVLIDIAQMPGFRGRGLLARILYALPPNTVGRRRVGASPPAEDVTSAYADHLRHLVLTLADWTDPAVLPLTPDGNQRVLEQEAAIEPRLDPETGDLAHLADWASKLTGATVRLAGLLHLATHHANGWNRPISGSTVEAAARLGHYYLAHALAAFDHMGADPLVDDARAVLAWITRAGATRLTRRDAFNALRGSRYRKVTDLDPALGLLVDHGYLRPVPAPPPAATGGRPPSPAYDAHPACAEPAQPAQPPTGGAR